LRLPGAVPDLVLETLDLRLLLLPFGEKRFVLRIGRGFELVLRGRVVVAFLLDVRAHGKGERAPPDEQHQRPDAQDDPELMLGQGVFIRLHRQSPRRVRRYARKPSVQFFAVSRFAWPNVSPRETGRIPLFAAGHPNSSGPTGPLPRPHARRTAAARRALGGL